MRQDPTSDQEGRRCSRQAAAPLETFFEVFLRRNIENVQGGLTTRRAALGAADLERAARETPPPPRRDLPRAACARQPL